MAGLTDAISSMTGAILDSVRPARMIWAGLAVAKDKAVSAPSPLLEAPVIMTELRQRTSKRGDEWRWEERNLGGARGIGREQVKGMKG